MYVIQKMRGTPYTVCNPSQRSYHYVSNCKCSIEIRETSINGQTLQDLDDNYLKFTKNLDKLHLIQCFFFLYNWVHRCCFYLSKGEIVQKLMSNGFRWESIGTKAWFGVMVLEPFSGPAQRYRKNTRIFNLTAWLEGFCFNQQKQLNFFH